MINLEKGINVSTVYVVTDGKSAVGIPKEDWVALNKYLKSDCKYNVVLSKDSDRVRQLIITYTVYCDAMHPTNW
jgi:hypothetical protein